ncbi:MAG: glycine cleavage system protein H [Eubacteriales bacterium]|jgi:glycine cleavage system H protein|nr:glycine cleavage system protein H [Eubacteriales bacterium]
MAYEVRPTALYTAADTWAKALPNGLIQIGISDFAQQQLGDLMYIDLKSEGDAISAGESFGEAESSKATSGLISPVSGKIAEINQAVLDDPETVNNSPYDSGWLICVEPDDWAADKAKLLNSEAYKASIAERE